LTDGGVRGEREPPDFSNYFKHWYHLSSKLVFWHKWRKESKGKKIEGVD